jgi:hypothetical protein
LKEDQYVDADKTTVAHFDFVYYDPDRISSLYSQIFRGLLSGMVVEDQDSKSKQNTLGVLGGEETEGQMESTASEGSVSKSFAQSFEPHHSLVVDVLRQISECKPMECDPTTASPNSVIVVKGRVAFFDPKILCAGNSPQYAGTNPAVFAPVQTFAPLQTLDRYGAALPITYIFKTDGGQMVCGNINEDGLTDSTASHYIRYADAGIADVVLVGIKDCIGEDSMFLTPGQQLPAPLFSTGQHTAQLMRSYLSPLHAIRVTALAIYREI